MVPPPDAISVVIEEPTGQWHGFHRDAGRARQRACRDAEECGEPDLGNWRRKPQRPPTTGTLPAAACGVGPILPNRSNDFTHKGAKDYLPDGADGFCARTAFDYYFDIPLWRALKKLEEIMARPPRTLVEIASGLRDQRLSPARI